MGKTHEHGERGPSPAARAKARETAKARQAAPQAAHVRPFDLGRTSKEQRQERDAYRWQFLCDPALATGPARGLLTLHLDVHVWVGCDSSFTSMQQMADEASNSYAAVRRAFEIAEQRGHVRLEEHGRGYRITPLLWVDAEGRPAASKPYPYGRDTAQNRAQSDAASEGDTAQIRAQSEAASHTDTAQIRAHSGARLRSTLSGTALETEQLSPIPLEDSPKDDDSAPPSCDDAGPAVESIPVGESDPPDVAADLKARFPRYLAHLNDAAIRKAIAAWRGDGLPWPTVLDVLGEGLPKLHSPARSLAQAMAPNMAEALAHVRDPDAAALADAAVKAQADKRRSATKRATSRAERAKRERILATFADDPQVPEAESTTPAPTPVQEPHGPTYAEAMATAEQRRAQLAAEAVARFPVGAPVCRTYSPDWVGRVVAHDGDRPMVLWAHLHQPQPEPTTRLSLRPTVSQAAA